MSPKSDLELVRVAASRRSFLLSWRLYLVYLVVGIGYQIVVPSASGEVPGMLIAICAVGVWWFNRTRAVWIERHALGVTVRTRRWAKYEDLSSGRLRSDGTVIAEHPPGVTVSYEAAPQAWWRSDRKLTLGVETYAIYPESRALAAALIDESRWDRLEGVHDATASGEAGIL